MEEKRIKLNICYDCMKRIPEGSTICPACGNDNRIQSNPESTLPEGTVLFRKYLVGKVIGRGGFGITYIGYDLDLQLKVAIKEYFPAGVSIRSSRSYDVISDVSTSQDHTAFSKGCEAFLDEARMLASVESPYIVHVRDFFREHGTAYIVMNYVEGVTIPTAMRQSGGRIEASRMTGLVLPLIEQLDDLHEMNIIHRDIKPDNVMIVRDRRGEHLVLLDFGAARSFVSGNISKTFTAVVTPGFAPPEQYSQRSKQGAYTDVYGLCATLYYAITGAIPPTATERSIENVPIKGLREFGVNLPRTVETAIMHGLALRSTDRTQTMQQLYEELTADSAAGGISHSSPEEYLKRQTTLPQQTFSSKYSRHGKKKRKSSGRMKILPGVIFLVVILVASVGGFYLVNRNNGVENVGEMREISRDDSTDASETYVTPTPMPTEMSTGVSEAEESLQVLPVGDYVFFGSYEQDNNPSDGKEAIEWLVLARDGNKALLISKYALDCQQYNSSFTNITWENCTLRSWLNEKFLNAAFNSSEQKQIITSKVTADKNPRYNTSPGNDTMDKVFLLSITEVNDYFSSSTEAQCSPTEYAKMEKSLANSDGDNCWWWLRSPGFASNRAALVSPDGSVYSDGNHVIYDTDAVRPALWLNLDESVLP